MAQGCRRRSRELETDLPMTRRIQCGLKENEEEAPE